MLKGSKVPDVASRVSIEVSDIVQNLAGSLKHKPGALLPILHAVQNQIGYIPEGAVALPPKSCNRPGPKCTGSSASIITFAPTR
jgi:NADH:ubiquinone oxidoreductase subunit E